MKKNGERSKKKQKNKIEKKIFWPTKRNILEKKTIEKKWIILGENRTESIEIYI